MTKRVLSLAVLLLAAAAILATPALAADSWTGEVIDKACFDKQGAHGPDHADCAKRCLERGGDVGLLTAEGEVVLLKAHEDHADVFEALKAFAGSQAMVGGEMMEDAEGHTYVVVTSVDAVTS